MRNFLFAGVALLGLSGAAHAADKVHIICMAGIASIDTVFDPDTGTVEASVAPTDAKVLPYPIMGLQIANHVQGRYAFAVTQVCAFFPKIHAELWVGVGANSSYDLIDNRDDKVHLDCREIPGDGARTAWLAPDRPGRP
jgi:hypothetical protein